MVEGLVGVEVNKGGSLATCQPVVFSLVVEVGCATLDEKIKKNVFVPTRNASSSASLFGTPSKKAERFSSYQTSQESNKKKVSKKLSHIEDIPVAETDHGKLEVNRLVGGQISPEISMDVN